MKTLLILRHGKSDWSYPALADHDRPLNQRGKRDVPRMGRLLRHEQLTPDLIISSTAKRARKSASLAAEACGYDGEIQLAKTLYLAGPEAYLEILHLLPDKCRSVMVVGHNPGLEELLETLTGEAETLSTAALAQVSLPVTHWRDLDGDTEGKLVNVWRPRELET